MKIKTLGIFDSGLGGYSVYHYLVDNGPQIEYVLYADQKNAPYGNKDLDEIYAYAKEGMEWFKRNGIDHVLLACNTVSALALDKLKKEFPQMKIWGIIDLTLNQIKDSDAKISVLATQATCKSHAYKNNWSKPKNIFELGLKNLVAMIEDGKSEKEIDAYLKEEVSNLPNKDILILACTHFPLVKDAFEKYFSGSIVDSQKPILELVESIADKNSKTSQVYTSGDVEVLRKQIKNLFHKDEKVRRI